MRAKGTYSPTTQKERSTLVNLLITKVGLGQRANRRPLTGVWIVPEAANSPSGELPRQGEQSVLLWRHPV